MIITLCSIILMLLNHPILLGLIAFARKYVPVVLNFL